MIATGGIQDHRIGIHHIEGGSRTIEAYGVTWSLAYSSHGLLAVGTQAEIELWDTTIPRRMYVLAGHRGWVRSLAFSPNGLGLLSGSRDGTMRAWNLETGEEVFRMVANGSSEVAAVALSPDGKRAVCGMEDGRVEMWDLPGNALCWSVRAGSGVHAVAIDPKTGTIAAGSQDGKVRLWNPHGEGLQTLLGHRKFVTGVAFSADGSMLMSSSADQSIRIWNEEADDLRGVVAVGGTCAGGSGRWPRGGLS